MPHRAAVRLNEPLLTSQLVSVSDGTHYPMFDSQECFVAELSRFLDASEPGVLPPAERRRTRHCS